MKKAVERHCFFAAQKYKKIHTHIRTDKKFFGQKDINKDKKLHK